MGQPVYLVRHGQSEWNVRRLTQGQTRHPALTPLGRQQAAESASALALDLARLGLASARLVTSDLVRAVETARIIGDRLGSAVELDPRLREQDLGWLEGRSYADTWAAGEQHDWSDPTLPVAGGESLTQVRTRLGAVLDGLGSSTATVLVSHGDSIRAGVAYLMRQPPHQSPWLEVPNGAVFRYDGRLVRLAGSPEALPLE